MSEKLKGLLEKINEEGVKQAEEKARAIEQKAKKDAGKILKDASVRAQKIVDQAKEDAEKTSKTTEIALKQASRDLMLSLKDEIRKIFNKIISDDVREVMSGKAMAVILGNLIEGYMERKGESSDIAVLLKKEDLEKLKKTSIAKLRKRLKEGIEFRPSPNINAGFSISFDKGKSFFDFTEEGLREALCAYLNPELSRLLK
jgi:V/A-type H+-transporting ATPase subunit E